MSALGQKRTNRPGPKFSFVRFGPIADKLGRKQNCPLFANSKLPPKKPPLFSLATSLTLGEPKWIYSSG